LPGVELYLKAADGRQVKSEQGQPVNKQKVGEVAEPGHLADMGRNSPFQHREKCGREARGGGRGPPGCRKSVLLGNRKAAFSQDSPDMCGDVGRSNMVDSHAPDSPVRIRGLKVSARLHGDS